MGDTHQTVNRTTRALAVQCKGSVKMANELILPEDAVELECYL